MNLFFLTACNNSRLDFQDYNFELKGYEWDKEAYKFKSSIKNKIALSEGNESAATEFSYIGDIESTLKYWDKEYSQTSSPTAKDRQLLATLEKREAISYITSQAAEKRLVIINEAHHVPQHRIFTAQLLDELKEAGYSHLGLETYFNIPITDSLLMVNKYPDLKTGIYSKEPQFGNLIRLAIEKGFTVFGYEAMGKSGKYREIEQAENIQKYMQKHPSDKFLIHCGYSHGYEGDLDNSWEQAMAERVGNLMETDPLTINQVIYSERSELKYENSVYQLTDLDESTVFLTSDGKSFGEYKYGGYFDIAVFHTRRRDNVRPNWMIYDQREVVEISFLEEEVNCPCLVLAYVVGEEIGSAIPYDVLHVEGKSAELVLDKEKYNIVVWSNVGKSIMARFDNS